jgi:uncharacterized membrane-anchored protein YjiN (DUF445 family)
MDKNNSKGRGRFDYIKYDDKARQSQESFKECFEALEDLVNNELADGRSKSLVFTKLEEAYMWVGKAIRDDQVVRNGSAPLQEERG